MSWPLWLAGMLAPVLLLFLLTGSNPMLRLFAILLQVFVFIIRLIKALLLHFSGQGFDANVLLHLQWQSIRVGWAEYGLEVSLALSLLLCSVYLAWKLTCREKALKFRFIAMPIVLALWAIGHQQTAEGELLQVLQQYLAVDTTPILVDTTQLEQARQALIPLRGDRPLPPAKANLESQLPAQAINLITLYLESFNDWLLDLPDAPALAPNLSRLRAKNGHILANHSAAYVTIEGIANSQCGTLFDMRHANNSLTTERGRLPQLPCLGDVLHQSGYHQVFLGGAQLSFAGKGAFLQAHGFDEQYGWDYWATHLPEREKTVWGLSDPDLFHQALQTIDRLKQQDKPWNLTLLTLGTHLPGFVYEGCPVYQPAPDEVFLNAVHCTDYLVGQFVQALEQRGVLNHTLLVIQGDHGVFPNPEMKRLFGPEKVQDRRLLTLFIGAGSDRVQPDAYMASTDLAPTVLDLLQLQHNATFILGKSVLKPEATHYRLTRYGDYKGDKFIPWKPTERQCELSQTLSLHPPLESCERQQALNLIYQVNSQYAKQIQQPTRFIHARIQNQRYWYLKINQQYLSGLAMHAGRAVSSLRSGYRLLWLDEQFQPDIYLFFPPDDPAGLKQALHDMKTTMRSPYFLLSVTGTKWPEGLHLPKAHAILLGRLHKDHIEIIQQDDQGELVFYPHGPAQASTTINLAENTVFCPIIRWGPQQTTVDQPFNQQKDGRSAWWLKTDCAPKNARWLLDGQPLDTVVRLPVITAALHADALLETPGQHKLELLDPETGLIQLIGLFQVEAATN